MKIAFSAISLIFSTAVTASPFVPKLTSRALPSLSYSAFISPLTSTSFPLPSSSSSSSSLSSSTTTNLNMSPLPECPTIPLRDGTPHHAIGFGTYKVGYIPPSSSAAASATASNAPLRTATECIADALKVGYRFFECAEFYNNEAEVGKAIKESGIARENLFLCSKVWTTTIEKGEEAIRARLDQTLADLGTDYLDLYLIHWPVPTHHISAYKTLEKLKLEGKIHNIGVSNYVIEDYKELLDSGITVKPAVNQIEINPFLYRKNTIEYFRKQNVVLQSYRSLRDGKAMDHPTLKSIAESHGKTPAQILGRWCVQHGFVYIPKSVKLERMKENAEVFDFELTEKEMQELDNLTTPEALETFKALYQKCVNRDTTKDGTMEGVKMDITVD